MISFHAFSGGGEAAARVFRWNLASDQLGYTPTNNWDANNCEFYIDGTFGRTFAHDGAHNNTLNFYFHIDRESIVDSQHSEILNLAAFDSDPDSECLVKGKDNIVTLSTCRFAEFIVPNVRT
jgi:hypothetical protein